MMQSNLITGRERKVLMAIDDFFDLMRLDRYCQNIDDLVQSGKCDHNKLIERKPLEISNMLSVVTSLINFLDNITLKFAFLDKSIIQDRLAYYILSSNKKETQSDLIACLHNWIMECKPERSCVPDLDQAINHLARLKNFIIECHRINYSSS